MITASARRGTSNTDSQLSQQWRTGTLCALAMRCTRCGLLSATPTIFISFGFLTA